MKPFDLEKALAGEPVVTRSGVPVTDIHCFDGADEAYKVCALVEGRVVPVHADGRYLSGGESAFDLFMAPVKRVGWVNIYNDRSCSSAHESEDDAKRERTSAVVATIKVEWEE